MSSIDERIVEMKFNNGQFEDGVKQTNKSLDDLKKGLNLDESAKSLSGLQSVGDRFSLANLASGVEGIAGKFSTLGIVGVTALADITAKAIDTGIQVVKSLTVDHIADGFRNYETGINAVQTILANTQAAGTTLPQVTKALAELNKYANQTVYNFADMTKNIGTFTAAGVNLPTAVASIKGIANLAAMSGSSAEQASGAMYQLSQAIAAGKVGLQDWNSVVNAGIGGKTFQMALENTARASGVSIDAIIKKQGSFRQSLQTGWLTSSILTKTLDQFTGDLSDKQLRAMGYTEKEAQAIQKQAKTASDAATKIKTITQLQQALGEEVGTAWAKVFSIVLGNINQAKDLLSPLHTLLENGLTNPIYAMATALQKWADLGGRTELVKAFWNALQGVQDIIAPITKAFHDMFPPVTGQQLKAITDIVASLAEKFKMAAAYAGPDLYRIFRGLFAVLDIGRMIIIDVVKMFERLFASVGGPGPLGFLDLAAKVGDFLYNMDQAIKKGDGLTTFFNKLGDVLAVPIALIGRLSTLLYELGQGKYTGKINDFFVALGKNLNPVNNGVNLLGAFWARLVKAMQDLLKLMGPIGTAITIVVSSIGAVITDMLSGKNYNTALDTLNTAIFGGILLMIKKFVTNAGKEKGGIGSALKGVFGQVSGVLEGVTGTLEGMQQKLKADVLLRIAAALALLAASVVALSLVDSGKLTVALGAMSVMFAQLLSSMALFGKLSATAGIAKLPIVAAAMIEFAIAIDILTSAVKRLAGLNWNGLAKGLLGVGVLLGEISLLAKVISPNTKGLIAAGAAMILIGTALNILAKAVAALGGMQLGAMVQGLSGVGVALGIIAGFSHIINPKDLIATGVALNLVGSALTIFAAAISILGKMGVKQLAEGLGGMGVALAIVAGAVRIMPGGVEMTLKGAALAIIATAMVVLASALRIIGALSPQQLGIALVGLGGGLIIIAGAMLLMQEALPGALALGVAAASIMVLAPALMILGNMSWESVGKSLVELAGGLAILAGALALMTEGLPGALALVTAAGAILILAPALVLLGTMSWAAIGQGLTAMAGALAILVIAGAAAEPVAPGLLALSTAILLIGIGTAAAGVGLLALSAGLTGLAVSGVAGAVGITALATSILNLIPLLFKELGQGIVEAATAIDKGAGAIAKAIVDVLSSVVDGLVKIIPKIVVGAYKIITALAEAMLKYEPHLLDVGSKLIIAVSNGIAQHADKVVTAIINALSAILNAISKHIGQLTNAGTNVVVAILNGIARHISKVVDAGTNIMVSLLNAIAKRNQKVIDAGTNIVTSFVGAIGKSMNKIVTAGTNAVVNFLNGLTHNMPRIATAGTNTVIAFITAVGANSARLTRSAADTVIKFVNSLATTIKTKGPQLKAAGLNLASAIIDGMTGGLSSRIGDVISGAADLGNQAIKAVQRAIDSHSPSREFYKLGQFATQGFALGLSSTNRQAIDNAFNDMKDKLHTMITDSANSIKSEKARLDTLESAHKKNEKAIRAEKAALAESEKEHSRASNAYNDLTKHLNDEGAKLNKLSDQYAVYTDRINTAKQALADATKTRDDYNTSIQQQYGALATISADTTLSDYEAGLQSQVDATVKFTTQLQELRTLGLNDTMYKQLLSQGPASSNLVDELIQSGKAGVATFDSLSDQVAASAATLGKNASTVLYQAAVDSAAGLVKGLEAQQGAIEKQMQKIADYMVNSIKKSLGIHSPSTVMAEVGGYSIDGIVGALDAGASTVADSASNIGDAAVAALQASMSGIGDAVAAEVDINPTIKPVLDLTGVRKSAAGLGSLLNTTPISIDATANSAAFAGNGLLANQDALAAAKQAVSTAPPVTFNQYNNSPVALGAVEIYRQTKNQLSVAKGVVSTSVN